MEVGTADKQDCSLLGRAGTDSRRIQRILRSNKHKIRYHSSVLLANYATFSVRSLAWSFDPLFAMLPWIGTTCGSGKNMPPQFNSNSSCRPLRQYISSDTCHKMPNRDQPASTKRKTDNLPPPVTFKENTPRQTELPPPPYQR
jgi:hypothetical protein